MLNARLRLLPRSPECSALCKQKRSMQAFCKKHMIMRSKTSLVLIWHVGLLWHAGQDDSVLRYSQGQQSTDRWGQLFRIFLCFQYAFRNVNHVVFSKVFHKQEDNPQMIWNMQAFWSVHVETALVYAPCLILWSLQWPELESDRILWMCCVDCKCSCNLMSMSQDSLHV